MATLVPAPKFHYRLADGTPAAGYKLYAYQAGSSTPKDTYTTQTGAVANTNPVILDANGEADIWLDGNYKLVLKTAADVTVWTVDSVESYLTDLSTTTFTNAFLLNTDADGCLDDLGFTTLTKNFIDESTAASARAVIGAASASAFADHDARHIWHGDDEIDSDMLSLTYSPTYYTPDADITEVTSASAVSALAAHFKGIDDAFGLEFKIPVRESILISQEDFLVTSGAGKLVASASVTYPLVMTFAGGFDARGSMDSIIRETDRVSMDLSGTSSGTTYIVLAKQSGSTFTMEALDEGLWANAVWESSANPVSGACQFNIWDMEFQRYDSAGSTWDAESSLSIGEFIASSADTISAASVVSYSVRGLSWIGSQTFAANTNNSVNHNLGLIPEIIQLQARCISADANYSVGDVITVWDQGDNAANNNLSIVCDRTAAETIIGASLRIPNKTTFAGASLTFAKWLFRVICKRGW